MTVVRKGLRLDLVIRTSERKRDGQSPTQQRQQADGICLQGGHEVVFVHDSARSESGKTMERQALHAARERIRAGETDGIVVGYLDRLGRAPIEESMAFVRSLIGDGGVLVAADWSPDPIDLNDPNTEDMLVFRLQMDRSQWNKAAERYRLSQRNAVKAGKFIGPTPLGYGRREGRLYEHPVLGRVIHEAYAIAATQGVPATVSYLMAEVPDRPWTTDSVRKLLASRVYLGEVWMWQRENGRRHRVVNANAHKALTDEDTWSNAQHAPHERRTNGAYPLSGIARCRGCGGSLVGQLQTTPQGYVYRRYRCASKGCRGGCSISADKLEAFVRSELKAALKGNEGFRRNLDPDGLGEAREAMEIAKARRKAFMAKNDPLDDDYEDALAGFTRQRDEAQSAYRALANHAARLEEMPGPEDLDDPERFEKALRLGRIMVPVHPGRGHVTVRALVTALDRDGATRLLSR